MKPLLPAILLTIFLTLPSAKGHAQESQADSVRYARLCNLLHTDVYPTTTHWEIQYVTGCTTKKGKKTFMPFILT